MTIWCMRIACWIPESTNTYSQCVILIAFPLQKWLHERASILRYTYIVCVVYRVGFMVNDRSSDRIPPNLTKPKIKRLVIFCGIYIPSPCSIWRAAGSVLGPLLCLTYTADSPTTADSTTATCADDTAVKTIHEDPAVATHRLQTHLNKIQFWLKNGV